MGVINFNGVPTDSKRFSAPILVEQPPSYAFPSRDTTFTHVPGRDGDIFVDNGSYNNVKRSYALAIGSESIDYSRLAYELSDWLHSAKGYAKLTDTYDPDHYCMAAFVDEGTIANILNNAGRLTVSFNCKPQRYLVTGDDTIELNTSGSAIYNPTMFEARPLIKVYGTFTSNATITLHNILSEDIPTPELLELEDQVITISKCTDYVIIDSELMDCYRIDNPQTPSQRSIYNANGDVSFSGYSFPVIRKGRTQITWTSPITKLEVIPRWWTI